MGYSAIRAHWADILRVAAYLKGMPIEEFADGCPRGVLVVHNKNASAQLGSDWKGRHAREALVLRARGKFRVALKVCLYNTGKAVDHCCRTKI